MNKIKTVKIKNQDGSVSEETYTISVDAKDVDMKNGKNLQDAIGDINVDRDGNISEQLKNLNNNKIDYIDIIDNLESDNKNEVLSARQGKILNELVEEAKYNSYNKIYIAPLTKMDYYNSVDRTAYLGISLDGQCFTEIPSTRGFCSVNTDIQLFKYNDYYLFACTTGSSSQNPNIDAYVGWTKDFENYHFEYVELGFTQYRDTNYSSANTDRRRWTPRFYLDKNNNLNMLISMATDNIQAVDYNDIQARTQMKIFHQTVTFTETENNFLTGNGDIEEFVIQENGTPINTFFDGEVIYYNNMYYLLYKNGYYNDTCIATSSNDYSTFNATKLNLFESLYSEAPCVVKNGEGWYIYGQQYRLEGFISQPRNLLLYTKDFVNFDFIGFPKRENTPIEKNGPMRNISPCLITDKKIIDKFKNEIGIVGTGTLDPQQIKTSYDNVKIINAIKNYYTLGRTVSPFPYSFIRCDSTLEQIYINNNWNAEKITVYGYDANMAPYSISFYYNGIGERAILSGSYPTVTFSFYKWGIRNENRSNIPISTYIKEGTSSKTNVLVTTYVTQNSQFAFVHLYNKSASNVWDADETIANIGYKNFQNMQQIYGTTREDHDPAYPLNSVFGLYVDWEGNVKSKTQTPATTWSSDFIFLLNNDFYK